MRNSFPHRLSPRNNKKRWGGALSLLLFLVSAVMFLWACLPLFYGVFHSGVLFLLLFFGFTSLYFMPLSPLRKGILRLASKKKCWKYLWHSVRALTAFGLIYTAVLSAGIFAASHKSPPSDDLPVIVLGSQVNGDRPSLMLERRLEAAKKYLEGHPQAVCIVSGGRKETQQYSEAWVMKKWLMEEGISGERILVEEKSTDTKENMQYSSLLLLERELGRRAVIATDFWHEWRGQLYGAQAGLETYAVPCSTPLSFLPTYYMRELFGLTELFLLGG